MSTNDLDEWLSTIPEALRAHAQTIGVREVGFRAGPGFIAGEGKRFDPPAEFDEALAWIGRYRHVLRRAHARLADDTVLWFERDGFSHVDERAAPVEPAGVVVDHRLANALQDARSELSGPEYATALAHLERFAEALGAFSRDDAANIVDALSLMLELHRDQAPRPDGEPYVSHTLDVAAQVVAELELRDRDVAMAALLHDAVEDQGAALAAMSEDKAGDVRADALSALRGRFGMRVGELVERLTNPDFDVHLAGEDLNVEVRRERKNALYLEHVERLWAQDAEAFAIKLCDFRTNALRLERVPEGARKQRLRQKYGPVVDFMIGVLEDVGEGHPLWEHRERLLAELKRSKVEMYE